MEKICLATAALTRLMPMHVVLADDGKILRFGDTVAKLFPDTDLTKASFFELFKVRQPQNIKTVADIVATDGSKLHLELKNTQGTALKAVGIELLQGGNLLMDMSFGISVVDAISDYNLTISDFSPTDLAVEMLYLLEAKSAAMNESRKLNTRLQGAKVAAEEQAFTDTLTGLKNRRAMDHVIEQLLGAGEPFGLMQIDLDYFKAVNDNMGHAAGDYVLREVARILNDETRRDDLVARVGGDEFVLVLNRLTDIDKLNEIADRIIRRLEVPIPYQDHTCRISASIGTTVSDMYQSPDKDRMLGDADMALYASKDKGKACYTVFSPELLNREQPQTPLAS
ncbi:MAG: GGDEF domain-containing protein [Rhodobacterales bacterium]|nr:MAG: GGDEF domain-containing protein [Rhodobacterales bacterium]